MTGRPDAAAPAHADLFGSRLLPGLSAQGEFLTAAEEAMLIARIEAAELTPFRFQQWEGKRLTRSYGWHYDFETGAFSRTEPLPKWLLPIAARAASFAGIGGGAKPRQPHHLATAARTTSRAFSSSSER